MSNSRLNRVRAAANCFQVEGLERRLLLSNVVRFASELAFSVGLSPNAVAAADLNGDGNADLVSANYYGNSVSVLLGNGNGAFKPQQSFAAGQEPFGVSIADVNNDNKPDLLVTNSAGASVSVLLGNGNGTFQAQRTFSVGTGPANVVAADVNGDGRPDLIVTNQAAGTVSVLLGNGNGTFQPQSTMAAGASPKKLAAADLNGDGKPDLIVANAGAFTVSVFLGNGNGTFHAQQIVNVGADPYGMAVADLNGDGTPDLVVGSHLSTTTAIDVLLGNGNGTFQAPQTFATGHSPSSIVVSDLNGDGKPDLAVGNYTSDTVGVLLGNGNGTFLHQQTFAFVSNPGHVIAADLDGDGIPDLIADQFNTNSVGVLLNRSVPPRVLSINRTSPAGSTVSGASATFTVTFNKTVTGVVAGDFSVGTTGGVSFTGTNLTPVSGTVYTFTVNGISGTGTLGLNLVDNGTIFDLAGQPLAGGVPTFSSRQTFAIGPNSNAVVTGDLNGDGRADVAVTQLFGPVEVLLGNGNGTLQAARTFSAGLRPDAITIADVNGDGKPDLIVGNYGLYNYASPGTPGTVSVLLGNGNGTFQAQKTFGVGFEYPTSVQVADINGDGKPDLIVGSLYQNSVYDPVSMTTSFFQTGQVTVLLGNGNGTFFGPETIAKGLDTVGAISAIGDFNADGKTDLAINLGAAVRILLGNGNGTFQAARTINGLSYGALSTADVNGDGVPDLLLTGGGTTTVLLGQGNGNFQPPIFSPSPTYSGILADFNGDGNLDLIGASTGIVSIFQGNGDGTFASGQTLAGIFAGALATADLSGDGRPDVISCYTTSGTTGGVAVLLGGPDGSFTGQVFTVVLPPAVSSINRAAPSTAITSASSLSFAVNFTSTVTNVLASDFQILTTGDVAATTPVVVSGSGSSYTVTVNGVHGSGTLELELVDNDTIADPLGTPLGGVGLFNGSFTGQSYTIVQSFPTVLSINRTTPPGPTTVDSSVSFTVTFSEAVTGVVASDFSLALAGVSSTPPLVVTGSGAVYTVTVNGISGSGTLALNLVDNGSIRDAAGNPLAGAASSFALQNQQTVNTGPSSSFVTSFDVNGDGKSDLIIANDLAGSAGAVSVLLGNGNGTFAARQTFAAGSNPNFVAVADVNGDGKPDLLVVNDTTNGTVSVLLGNGNGTFAAPATIAVGSHPASMAVADLNGDGRPDLVVGSGSAVGVLLSNGNGTFQPQLTLAAGTDPYAVTLADVNGDGKPDILAANFGSASTSVLLGNGNGTFQGQQSSAVGASPRNIAAADVNGDGQLDLILSSGSSGSVSILLGNANGTFQAQQTFATTGGAYGLTVADVNGDGKLDLVLGSNSGSAITLLLGNGNGSFQTPQTFATGASPVSVAFGDFNADGRVDLVSANNSSGTSSVLLGNSNGNFTGQTYIIVPPADTINGTSGADTVTLTRDTDGTDIDWGLFSSTGSSNGILPINDPRGLTINGNGGNDTIVLSYTNGNPLPNALHLNGIFTISGLQGTNPLAGTTLEIGRSTVFISYSGSDPIAAIQSYLKNGYNAGAWNGAPTVSTGVITSTAAAANPNHTTGIGYADFADGQHIDTMPNTIELTYTVYGDANLDHQVNSADLQILLFNLNRPGAWDQGDFNYDAQVNSADLQILLFTFNTILGSQAAPTVTTASPATSNPPPQQQAPSLSAGPATPVATHPRLTKPSHHKRRT